MKNKIEKFKRHKFPNELSDLIGFSRSEQCFLNIESTLCHVMGMALIIIGMIIFNRRG